MKFKHLLLLFILHILLLSVQSQSGATILLPAITNSFTFSNSNGCLQFENSIHEISLKDEINVKGNFQKIEIEGYYKSSQIGLADLPEFHKLIEIPASGEPQISIDDINWQNYNLRDQIKIYPCQAPVSRNDTTKNPSFIYNIGNYLIENTNFPDIVSLEILGNMMGKRMARIIIKPFRYHPAKNYLEICFYLKARISFINQKNTTKESQTQSGTVIPKIFKALPNPGEIASKPIKYLILGDSIFRNTLKPFIQWKTKKGYNVIEAYKGQPAVGNTITSMKAYLQNLYESATEENPAPTYLLIVGDIEKIPTFYRDNSGNLIGHATDLYYCEFNGNGDYFPEMYYGRFSASDTVQLKAQIDKTIEYESYAFNNPSFFTRTTLVAGVDGNYTTYMNGQLNYINENYLNLTNGITTKLYLSPQSAGKSSDIIKDINNGVGIVNYSGHGNVNYWESPRISIANTDTLRNLHMYPLIIANGCITGAYDEPVCLGEAFVRAPGKGAIGYIGCSDDSYWDEDYWWAVGVGPVKNNPSYGETGLGAFDRLFHSHGEGSKDWFITQSQVLAGGNLAITEASSYNMIKYYWEIYNLLGDPSLMIYKGLPSLINATYEDTVPMGCKSLVVKSDPNTYVALSCNGKLLDARGVDSSGLVNLYFPQFDTPASALLLITGENKKPLFDTVHFMSVNQPYISVDTVIISEPNNGKPDCGDSLSFDLILSNKGLVNADSVLLNVSNIDSCLILGNQNCQFGKIKSNQTFTAKGVCNIKLSKYTPDRHYARINLQFTAKGGYSWDRIIEFNINAPIPLLENIFVNDSNGLRPNQTLDAGESALLQTNLTNLGHSKMFNTSIQLVTNDTSINLTTNEIFIDSIAPGETTILKWPVTMKNKVATGKSIPFNLSLNNEVFHISRSFNELAGLVYDDFETGGLTRCPWNSVMSTKWSIDTIAPYEGQYSLRSAKIVNNQNSTIQANIQVLDFYDMTFYYKISSEEKFDFLKFYIDGILKGQWSGEIPWTLALYSVTPGLHQFKWIYSKDGNTSNGQDAAWIDNVLFSPSNPPFYSDIKVVKIVSPNTGFYLSNNEYVTILLKNIGNIEVSNIPIHLLINGSVNEVDTIKNTLFPADSLNFTFNRSVDLSVIGNYDFNVFIDYNGDYNKSNDTICQLVRNSDLSSLELYKSNGVTIFPNPVKGIITVSSENETIKYIEILDISGRLIRKYKINEAKATLNLSEFSVGSYIILVSTKSGIFRQKVVRIN